MSVTVTDPRGMTIPGIRISASGPSERSGETDPGGQLRFTGLQTGTYRLGFTGEGFVTFEREVAVRAGQTMEVDVTLTAAPPPPPPPPPPAAPAPVAAPVGPVGQPQALSVVDLIDKAFLEGPRRELLVSCSGNTRVALVQMSQEQPARLYEDAEVTYYVLGGEGVVRLGTRESALKQDSFISVPRGVSHVLAHRGRRPLILLTSLSGEPCEQAK